MTTVYEGNDIDEWIEHFKISQKLSNYLKETLEANFVEDLVYVYEDAEMLKEVEANSGKIEFRRFMDAKKKTHVLGGGFDATVTNATVTNATVTSAATVTLPVASAVSAPPAPAPLPLAVPIVPPAPPVAASISRVDHEVDAQKRELLELEMKLAEEKEKHRRAVEKTKKIEHKKKKIGELEERVRRAASLDMVFLLDCTGSMRTYIDKTKNNINEFVQEIHKLHPNISLRLAFIGYRDHCDKEDRLAVMRFTNSVAEFVSMVSNQNAKGGGDDAEDVLGGLHVVRGLDWQSETRIVYHIADAPAHGREFHGADISDDYKDGDPNGLSATDVLRSLQGQNVIYYFGKIKPATDIMIERFNTLVPKSMNEATGKADIPYVTCTPITGFTMMETVTKSVTKSFSESLSISARTDEPKVPKREVVLDPVVPDWSDLPVEATMRFAMVLPSSVDEMIDTILYTDDDRCISDFPDSDRFRVKVAPSPFAKGEMRAAHYAQLIQGSEAIPIILKESLATSPSHLTKPKYEAFLSCHRAAKALSRDFTKRVNALKGSNPIWDTAPTLDFVDACIIQFMVRRGQPFMIQESAITDAEFEKYNNNSGYTAPNPTLKGTNHDLVQAFSHWTYHYTKQQMMAVDCQGGYNRTSNTFMLTDPAIHFTDVTHFGGTNMGKKGFDKFFSSHVCNGYCAALGLCHPKA